MREFGGVGRVTSPRRPMDLSTVPTPGGWLPISEPESAIKASAQRPFPHAVETDVTSDAVSAPTDGSQIKRRTYETVPFQQTATYSALCFPKKVWCPRRDGVTNNGLGVIPLCLLRTLADRFATCLDRGASTEDLEEDVFKKLEDNRESVAIPLDNGGEPHLPMVNKQNLQTLVSKGDCA